MGCQAAEQRFDHFSMRSPFEIFFHKKSSFTAVMLYAPSQVRGTQRRPLGPKIGYRSDSATNFLLPRGRHIEEWAAVQCSFHILSFKEINGYSMDCSMR